MNTAPASRAVVASAAVLLLTSCGSLPDQMDFLAPSNKFLEQSPRSIAKASFADMQDVTSMRILGSVNLPEYGKARIDVRAGGTGCVGRFDTDDGAVKFVSNKTGSWLGLDDEMWTSQSSSPQEAAKVLDRYSGTWFAGEKKALAKLCDVDKLLSGFEVDDGDRSKIDVGTVEEIGGVDAIPLSGRDGKKHGTVWIAVDAPHRVVKMSREERNELPEVLFFEEFGATVIAESPAKKNIVQVPGT